MELAHAPCHRREPLRRPLERTLYNGFLSGLSLDGESFFYANPLQSRTGEHRHRWNPVACCPPNIMRLLASLHHYLATVTDDGIQLHQYASSTIRAGRRGPQRGDALPLGGTVRVEVVESPDREWTLSLRIPGWAREATLDGEAVAPGDYAEADTPLAGWHQRRAPTRRLA